MWKYEVDMLKIIIIMIGYTLDNFITHSYENIIVDHNKINNFEFLKKEIILWKKIIINFVNVETDPRLR